MRLFRVWMIPLVAAVAIALVGWWTNGVVERQLKANLAEQLRTLLRANVASVTDWMDDEARITKALSEEPAVRAGACALADLYASGADLDALREAPQTALLHERIDPIAAMFGFGGWAVVSLDRHVIGTDSGRLVGITVPPEAERLVESALAGEPLVSPPWRAHNPIADEDGVVRPGVPVMYASAAVHDDAGEPCAVLGMRIDPREDFTPMLGLARSGETGETYAFGPDGQLYSFSRFEDQLRDIGLLSSTARGSILEIQIRDPGGDLTRDHVLDRPVGELPLTRAAASAVRGETGVDVDGYRDYRGVPVVGAWTWLPEYGFGMVTEIDVAEAFRPIHLLQRVFHLLFGLLALAGVGMFLYTVAVARLQKRVTEAMRLGQYTLEQKLGEGGMGTVYRASHALLRRPTAIKLIRGDADERAIGRFEREVQLTSQLTHPNTVAIYDYGRTPSGIFYYAMEYLAGINLHDLTTRYGPVPPGRVVNVLRQTAASLREAHSVGLIHRDIKPANIVLTERGGVYDTVKVLDFGLVKDVARPEDLHLTREGMVTGTPYFMSPESITDPDGVDARSDLYALGSVAWFLLTGKYVFDGASSMEICLKHGSEQPAPPSSVQPGIPPDLDRLVLDLLAKDPENRPPDAQALLDRLAGISVAAAWTQEDATAWWQIHGEEVERIHPKGDSTHSRLGSGAKPTLVVDLRKKSRLGRTPGSS